MARAISTTPCERHTVVALIKDAATAARLRAVLAPLGPAHIAATPAGLLAALERSTARAVIVECGADEDTLYPLLRSVRQAYPSVPVLAYCDLTAEHMKRVPALVRAGADEVMLRGIDDVGSIIRRVVVDAESERAASSALATLSARVPESAKPFLAYCLARSERPLTVAAMARDLGVHRKTLCNRALAAGLPAPSTLISWCRLLHAARLLDDSARSVERAALVLGFGSGTALRNMLRRYTGLRPRELRRRGGYHTLLTLLELSLANGGRPPATSST